MRLTLFHNPTAGKGETSKAELLQMLREAGHEVTYRLTDDDGYQKTLEDLGDWVVVAGGDGTVGKILPRLVGRDVAVGLLPLGTANNVARTLGLTAPLREIIGSWSLGRTRPFDVGIVEGPWGSTRFIESVGAGLIPRLIQEAKTQKEKEGHSLGTPEEELAFILQLLLDQLDDFSASAYRITLDGEDFTGEYLLVEAMNIRSVGPNLALAPSADPGDGHLNLVLLTEQDRPVLRRYVQERLAGKEPAPDLRVRRGQKIHLAWDGLEVHLDDEVKEITPGSFTVSLLHPSLRVLA